MSTYTQEQINSALADPTVLACATDLGKINEKIAQRTSAIAKMNQRAAIMEAKRDKLQDDLDGLILLKADLEVQLQTDVMILKIIE